MWLPQQNNIQTPAIFRPENYGKKRINQNACGHCFCDLVLVSSSLDSRLLRPHAMNNVDEKKYNVNHRTQHFLVVYSASQHRQGIEEFAYIHATTFAKLKAR
jgi:hypothetical protein